MRQALRHGVFLLATLACFAAMSVSAAENPEREARVIDGFFRSLTDKEPARQREILRQIALYPVSEESLRAVLIPNLAVVMLEGDYPENVRREAVKALVEKVGRDRGLRQPFITLLQRQEVTIDFTLDAILQTGDAVFLEPLSDFIGKQAVYEGWRERALLVALAVWDLGDCAPALMRLHAVHETAPPTSEAPSDTEVVRWLRRAAAGASSLAAQQALKAQLLLGCYGDGLAVAGLLARFPGEMEGVRYQVARFLGLYRQASAMPALGECSRSDRASRVRLSCLYSLFSVVEDFEEVEMQRAAVAQLQRTYLQSPFRDKRLIVSLSRDLPYRELLLRALLKRERDKQMRKILDEAFFKTRKPQDLPPDPFGDLRNKAKTSQ